MKPCGKAGGRSGKAGLMFTLDRRLADDTVEITRWPVSLVLLKNDREYPWLILVPQRDGLRELHDVVPQDHSPLMSEITRASAAVSTLFRADKMNVSALGNTVDQLHIHVIARFIGDSSWPGPVRGKDPPERYEPAALHAVTARLFALLR